MLRRLVPILAALAAALVLPGPAQGAWPVRVVGGAPRWTRADLAGPGTRTAALELTFSPNGDGIRDAASIVACVPASDTPQLVVFHRFHRRLLTRMSSALPGARLVRVPSLPRCGASEQAWRGTWRGSFELDPDGPHPQGSYWMTMCVRPEPGSGDVEPASAFAATCAPKPALVRIQSVWLTLPWSRSTVAGTTLRPLVQTDARTLDVALADAAGTPVVRRVGVSPARLELRVPARLPAGMYRVQVRAGTAEVDAPFAVRGTTPIDAPSPGTALVVLPSLTWLAYDRADVDRDGVPDSWYTTGPANPSRGVFLHAPLITDRPGSSEEDHLLWREFFAWAAGRRMQVVTDLELAGLPPAVLDRYGAIVFPGHTEYYTAAEYDALQQYRARGGDLVFLSSNSFYRRVTVSRATRRVVPAWRRDVPCACTRTSTYSDYALTGTGFEALDVDRHVPMHVAAGAVEAVPWLFAGAGLRDGDALGYGVLELDGPAPAGVGSPASRTTILEGMDGSLPAVSAFTVEGSGARTFSAGNEAFVPMVDDPFITASERTAVRQLLDNLWTEVVGRP